MNAAASTFAADPAPDRSPHGAPGPMEPLRRALNMVLAVGVDLLGRIAAAVTYRDTSHLPRAIAANPSAAEARIFRGVIWMLALARALAGDKFYLPRSKSAPKPTAALATPAFRTPAFIGLERPPLTTEQAMLRTIRRAFATRPTYRIARKICRDLGIRPGSDAWPVPFLAITQTPAAWAAAHPQPADPDSQNPKPTTPEPPGFKPPAEAPPPGPQPPYASSA